MNNNPNRQDPNDVAAIPVGGSITNRFNPLWLLLLLLIPLLLLPFCHHSDTDRTADATAPATIAPASDAATVAASRARPTDAGLANPFTAVSNGPDMGKAVLNFDVNTTTPNPAATGTLSMVTNYLQANPAMHVSLIGYTDNSGSADANKELTQKRVANVKNALTSAGVDPSRITTANFGEAYPITDNSNPQARELNRRVEISLVR